MKFVPTHYRDQSIGQKKTVSDNVSGTVFSKLTLINSLNYNKMFSISHKNMEKDTKYRDACLFKFLASSTVSVKRQFRVSGSRRERRPANNTRSPHTSRGTPRPRGPSLLVPFEEKKDRNQDTEGEFMQLLMKN